MRHSATLFALLFFAFPFFVSCQFTRNGIIQGNHNLVNQKIDITDYDEILLSIPAEVLYQQFSDSTPYLQIHTDENIFASLDIKIEDRKLILSVKNDSIIRPSILSVYTSSHNLKQVSVAGSGDIYLKGEVNARDFNLSIAGSGDLRTDSLLCENITVRIAGSGNARLTGVGLHSKFSIAGSGNINAKEFFVQEAKCNISGSGNIHTRVSEILDASVSGSGDIIYSGEPATVNTSVAGSGKIKHD
jgi:hypothetical protein